MTIIVCSVCQRRFNTEETEAMPFCSHRCRLVDLGRWLDEEYGLPVDPEADGESDPSGEHRE